MRISESNLPIMEQIGAAIAGEAQSQMKIEGQAVLDMIEGATAMPNNVNMPLSSGSVGRTINIKV